MARGESGGLLDEFPSVRVGDGSRPLVILPGATDPLFDGSYPLVVHHLEWYYHRFTDDYARVLEEETGQFANGRRRHPNASGRDTAMDGVRVRTGRLPASVRSTPFRHLLASNGPSSR